MSATLTGGGPGGGKTAAAGQAAAAMQAATILERSVVLLLQCSYLGNTRSVRMTDLEIRKDGEPVKTKRGALHMTKQLFDTKTLQPVTRKFDGMRAWLRARSTPGHKVWGPSTYLIPYAGLDEVEAGLADWEAQIAVEVEKLIEKLPDAKIQRQADLGTMFNEAEFPTPAIVREEYSVDHNYVEFNAPDQLETVNRAVYERAVQKYDVKLSRMFDTVVLDLRQKALTVMKELANRLGDTKDGRQKGLRDTTALRDLRALVENFAALNSVSNDTDLAREMERIEALASGLDVQKLKDDKAFRASVLAATNGAVAALSGLVIDAERSFSFGSVPVEA